MCVVCVCDFHVLGQHPFNKTSKTVCFLPVLLFGVPRHVWWQELKRQLQDSEDTLHEHRGKHLFLLRPNSGAAPEDQEERQGRCQECQRMICAFLFKFIIIIKLSSSSSSSSSSSPSSSPSPSSLSSPSSWSKDSAILRERFGWIACSEGFEERNPTSGTRGCWQGTHCIEKNMCCFFSATCPKSWRDYAGRKGRKAPEEAEWSEGPPPFIHFLVLHSWKSIAGGGKKAERWLASAGRGLPGHRPWLPEILSRFLDFKMSLRLISLKFFDRCVQTSVRCWGSEMANLKKKVWHWPIRTLSKSLRQARQKSEETVKARAWFP